MIYVTASKLTITDIDSLDIEKDKLSLSHSSSDSVVDITTSESESRELVKPDDIEGDEKETRDVTSRSAWVSFNVSAYALYLEQIPTCESFCRLEYNLTACVETVCICRNGFLSTCGIEGESCVANDTECKGWCFSCEVILGDTCIEDDNYTITGGPTELQEATGCHLYINGYRWRNIHVRAVHDGRNMTFDEPSGFPVPAPFILSVACCTAGNVNQTEVFKLFNITHDMLPTYEAESTFPTCLYPRDAIAVVVATYSIAGFILVLLVIILLVNWNALLL